MAEDSKTYVFGQDNSVLSMLAPLLQQKGIDPGVLALMKDRSGFGGEGGWFMWIIFLFFLMGWGNFGYGNRGNLSDGLANQINNDYGRDLLLQAINGNGTAISQLATTLNCDVNAIQGAVNAVNSNVSNVGNQVGMSGMQVVNAIQSGNQALASQIASCCCENKLLVTNQGYENRIANIEQTGVLGSKIDNASNTISSQLAAQTTFLSDKFCDLEKRELQNKIDSLREKNSTLQGVIDNANQTNQIQNYIASTVTPLASEVASLKCKLPETVTVPYSPVTTVPNCVAYQYGLLNNGAWA